MNTAMKISTMARHLREGSRSVFRNGWMSFASASAISISLFILGVFLLLTLNVNQWARDVENQVEISIFLELDTTPEQINLLHAELAAMEEVSKVRFIPKDEGLELLKERMGEEGELLLEGFEGDENPLPDAFAIEVYEPRQVSQAAEKIKEIDEARAEPLIWRINYGKGTVEMLFKITDIVRLVGLVLVVGLAFTAMFLIANTIKLTIVARRREIGIMKLVGATNSFIRWPFFVEGALLGLIGSLIPVVVLLIGYDQLVKASKLDLTVLLIQMIPLKEIAPIVTGLLVGIGLVIGIWGSLISIHKFLKV